MSTLNVKQIPNKPGYNGCCDPLLYWFNHRKENTGKQLEDMTGGTDKGVEIRFKSMWDEREKARRNCCSETGEAVQ